MLTDSDAKFKYDCSSEPVVLRAQPMTPPLPKLAVAPRQGPTSGPLPSGTAHPTLSPCGDGSPRSVSLWGWLTLLCLPSGTAHPAPSPHGDGSPCSVSPQGRLTPLCLPSGTAHPAPSPCGDGSPRSVSPRGPLPVGPLTLSLHSCRSGLTQPSRYASRWVWALGCSSPSPVTISSLTTATGEPRALREACGVLRGRLTRQGECP